MPYPKSAPESHEPEQRADQRAEVSPEPGLPGDRDRGPEVLGPGRDLPRLHRQPRRRRGVGLLRRPAVRQRPAALRPPADRLRQGRLPALPDHARQEGGAALRLGHPRAARRAGGGAAARHHRQEPDRGDGARRLQPGGEGLRAALHPRVARVRHPPGALGRLRQRLQDARHQLHGVGDLGVQAAAREGPRLRGLPRAPVLLARPDPAVEPRTADGRRRLQDAAGPDGHRHLPAGRREGGGARPHRHPCARLDDDAVDAADQLRARGRPRHRVRRAAVRPERRRRLARRPRRQRAGPRAAATCWRRISSATTRRTSATRRPRTPSPRSAGPSAAPSSRTSSTTASGTTTPTPRSGARRTRGASSSTTTSPSRTAPASSTRHPPTARTTSASPRRPASRSSSRWTTAAASCPMFRMWWACRSSTPTSRSPGSSRSRAGCCARRATSTRTRTAGAAATR